MKTKSFLAGLIAVVFCGYAFGQQPQPAPDPEILKKIISVQQAQRNGLLDQITELQVALATVTSERDRLKSELDAGKQKKSK